MTRRRVAVTGIGIASPLGSSLASVAAALRDGEHGIQRVESLSRIEDMGTRLGAPVRGASLDFPRRRSRTLGRVAKLALFATEQAIDDSGLPPEALADGRTGIAYGSTHGSSAALESFCRDLLFTDRLAGISPRTYLKFMSHTCPANLAALLGIRGRVITTCSACTSASQGLGYGFEAVRHGLQDRMVCGGAEELHAIPVAIFDLMMATSTRYNDTPASTPRPFDRGRDGLVLGEGAGTFVLEAWDTARARGATIHAELVGYGTNCDGDHITAPAAEGMAACMRLALDDANLEPDEVDYVNAHATATDVGDIAESEATHAVFGSSTPISSSKGHIGHTLGACGAIEAAFCVAMMREGFLAPTRNLSEVDPRCAELDYVVGAPREAIPRVVMTNNFAFGGVNTSLILRRVDADDL